MNPQKPNILVEDAGKLLAQTNRDALVIITWDKVGQYQIVTVGRNKILADVAFDLGNQLANHLGLETLELLDDRRNKHNHESTEA